MQKKFYVNLGGNCEACSAFRRLKVEQIPSPFDWLGIPSGKLSELLSTNWTDDIFSPDNVITFISPVHGYLGVRDIKYHINSLHHFHKYDTQHLLTFRRKIKLRLENMLKCLENKSLDLVFIHREYYPEYAENTKLSIDSLKCFSDKNKLILVGEQPPKVLKSAVFIKCKLDKKYFLERNWLKKWHFIFSNIEQLEKGKIYDQTTL